MTCGDRVLLAVTVHMPCDDRVLLTVTVNMTCGDRVLLAVTVHMPCGDRVLLAVTVHMPCGDRVLLTVTVHMTCGDRVLLAVTVHRCRVVTVYCWLSLYTYTHTRILLCSSLPPFPPQIYSKPDGPTALCQHCAMLFVAIQTFIFKKLRN